MPASASQPDSAEPRPPERPLLERESERELLRSRVAAASRGEGSALVLEGPPGIGKTRLLEETVALAREAGVAIAAARGTELERDFGFGIARQVFEHRLADELDGEALLAGAAALAAPVFPAVALSRPAASEDTQAVIHGLYWLVVNAAREGPLLLAVDDAHWADPPSLRWLLYLINRVEELPVLLLIATRSHDAGTPDELLRAIVAHPAATVISPPPLSAEGIGRIASAGLSAEPAPAFVAACAELTRGNPYFVHAAIAAAASERIAPDARGAARLHQLAPGDVARSIHQRLASLPADAGSFARALAVFDRAPDPLAVARLADLSGERAEAAVAALAQADLTAPEGTVFVHPLVRSVIYAGVPGLERGRLHAQAAALLSDRGADPEQVALHMLASDPRGEAETVSLLAAAAARAFSRGAPEPAAAFLRRALAEPPAPERRAQLLYELGLAEVAADGITGPERIQEAIELEEDPDRRAVMISELGRIFFTQAQFAQAAAALEAGVASSPDPAAPATARMRALLMSIALMERDALARAGGLEGITRELESRAEEPAFLATLAWARVATRAPAADGADLAERALSDPALTLEQDVVIFAGAGTALLAAERLDTARAIWDDAIAAARSKTSIFALNFALVMRGAALMRLGEVAAVEADMREIIERAGEGALPREDLRASFPWVLAPLIDALIERGQLEEAANWYGLSGIEGEFPQQLQFTYLLDTVGRLRLAQGRAGEAAACFRECGERLGSWGIVNPGLVPWRTHLAAAVTLLGDRAQAVALASEEAGVARDFGVMRETGMALRAQGLARGGPEGIELLRESVEALTASPARLELARAKTDLGASLRRAGQRTKAREPLRDGLDLATRCGATALAERAHSELVAAGARPRRMSLSGVQSLTASEMRVASMVADGMTNRQVAETLFLTEKTVENHLSNVYRKLDLSSRSELPRALADPSPEAAS